MRAQRVAVPLPASRAIPAAMKRESGRWWLAIASAAAKNTVALVVQVEKGREPLAW